MAVEVLASTKDMSREQWLEWRRQGIGGSDAAAVAGLYRWRSPVGVWLEKTGQVEEDDAGEAAYWGKVLEDVVAREFSERTGLKVMRRNAILQHPQYPFMLANIDRYIVDKDSGRGVLECKTANEYLKGEWEDDKIPEAYQIQVQHYLAVTGLSYGYVAVLVGGNKFRMKRVERDDEVIKHLIKIESDFWRLVEEQIPPEMDGSDASKELLGKLYPESTPETSIELPASAKALIEEREQWRAVEDDAKTRKQAAENKIKQMLGDHELGYVGDTKVTWKTVVSRRFDSKSFKLDRPDLYQDYVKESVARRFLVS